MKKDEKVLQEAIFVNPWLDSYKEVFDNIDIDELPDKQHNDLSVRIENWTHKGSGWSVHSILQH